MHVKIHRIVGIKKECQGKNNTCFVIKTRGIYVLNLTLGTHLLSAGIDKNSSNHKILGTKLCS